MIVQAFMSRNRIFLRNKSLNALILFDYSEQGWVRNLSGTEKKNIKNIPRTSKPRATIHPNEAKIPFSEQKETQNSSETSSLPSSSSPPPPSSSSSSSSPPSSPSRSPPNVYFIRKQFREASSFLNLYQAFKKHRTRFIPEEQKKPFQISFFSSQLHKDQIFELSKHQLSELQYFFTFYQRFFILPDFVQKAYVEGMIHRLKNDTKKESSVEMSKRISKLLKTCKDWQYVLSIDEKRNLLDVVIQGLDSQTITSSLSKYCDILALGISTFFDEKSLALLSYLGNFEGVIDSMPIEDISSFIKLTSVLQIKIGDLSDQQSKEVYQKLLFRVLEENVNLPFQMIYPVLLQLRRSNINKTMLSLQQIDQIMIGIEKDFKKMKNIDYRVQIPGILGDLGFQYPDDLRKDVWDMLTVQLGEDLIVNKYSTFQTLSIFLESFVKVKYGWKDMPVELRATIFILLNRFTNQLEKPDKSLANSIALTIINMSLIGITWSEIPPYTQENIFKLAERRFEYDGLTPPFSRGLKKLGVTWDMIPEKITAPFLLKCTSFIESAKVETWDYRQWRTLTAFRLVFRNLCFAWSIDEEIKAMLLTQFATALDRSHDSHLHIANIASILDTLGSLGVTWSSFPKKSLKQLWNSIENYINRPKEEINEQALQNLYFSLKHLDISFFYFQEKSVENILRGFEPNPLLFAYCLANISQQTSWKHFENRKEILSLVHGQLEKRDRHFQEVFSSIIYGMTLLTFDWFIGPLTADEKEEFIQIHRPILHLIFTEIINDVESFDAGLYKMIVRYFDWLCSEQSSQIEPLLKAVGQTQIPSINCSRAQMSPGKKAIDLFGRDLSSCIKNTKAVDKLFPNDTNLNSFEIIRDYQGGTNGGICMPLAVKFNNTILAFINFVKYYPDFSGESQPSRTALLIDHVFAWYHPTVGVIHVKYDEIINEKHREEQIVTVRDLLFSLASSNNGEMK